MPDVEKEQLIELVTRKVLEELRRKTDGTALMNLDKVSDERAAGVKDTGPSGKRLITEKLVISLKRSGKETVIAGNLDIITPLAKDAIQRYGMKLVKDGGNEKP